MLKRQRNRLLEVIREAGLDPNDFAGGPDESSPAGTFVVRLKNSPLSFTAIPSEGDYESYNICHTLLAPDFPESPIIPDNGFVMPFRKVEHRFREWLDKVVIGYKEDERLPDLWAEVGASQPILEIYRNQAWDDQFSEAERVAIRSSMAGFRALLAEEFAPSTAQLEIIDQRLEYVVAALDRFNKFDWIGVAISTLITIAVGLSLDSSMGQRLFEMFRDALSSIARLLN
jgi:hypothetical protein